MLITADPGPTATPTSKDAAGFLAPTCMRYELTGHEPAEHSLSVIEGLEDVRGRTVAAEDVLRFYVHPELDEHLSWGAMGVSVDLLFTDGSRLSDLQPRDQYGNSATAQGLGAGKVLFPDQWNDVQISCHDAAGRTIADVLVVADPSGVVEEREGTVRGWIDGPYLGAMPADPPVDDLVAWVDTRRGTYSSGHYSRGNTLPLTAWPNGFVFLTPVTNARTNRWEYEYHRANNDRNQPCLQGIGISHQPSPWMGDRNQMVFMPLLGHSPSADPQQRALAFDHQQEIARPDRYHVTTADGLQVDLSPTDHGAVIQIDFPASSGGGHLLIEGVDESSAFTADEAPNTGHFHGWVDSALTSGGQRDEGTTRMFVYGTVDPAPVSVSAPQGSTPGATQLTFPEGTAQVTLRVVTSYIGVEQAQRTFAMELANRSLSEVREAAHQAWTERLSVITVPEATPAQRRTMYGNLYRLNLYPNSHFENTGTVEHPAYHHASPVLPTQGEATALATNAQIVPGPMYVNNGFWDTYRTAWPAYALLYPQLAAQLADGFVQQYREGGWIARWSSPGYADCMTGTSSDVSFADLAIKGVPLPDPLSTYASGLKNATVTAPHPNVGRKGNDRAVFIGYVSTDTPESVSWALEAHINDHGLAAQAELLAENGDVPEKHRRTLREEAAYLRARSMNYALLFDPEIGFFQGRTAGGQFAQTPEQFDPLSWGGDFTEASGWTFAFHAPHDGEGLAALYGGRDGLRAKLEEFFATEERADRQGSYSIVIHEMVEARAIRMGQFGVSNQPAHHIPFLFHHAGAPERASEIVHEVRHRLFVGEQIGQGYPGDEDNGEMSAWWLLAALGLYPLQLGTPNYHVVAPLFAEAVVRPLGGQSVTIRCTSPTDVDASTPRFIQELCVNGHPHEASTLTHEQLRGEIHVVASEQPGTWGAEAAVPQSVTEPGKSPQPLVDLIARDPSNPLFDDDSRTECELNQVAATRNDDGGHASLDERATGLEPLVIELPAVVSERGPRFYTLTSGSMEGADPAAWRLEAQSADGQWRVIDERRDEEFAWRRQTRPFQVRTTESSSQYRLVITAAPNGLTLSQIELLA